MPSNALNVYAAEPMATGGLWVFPLGTEPPAERDDPEGALADLPDSGVNLGHIGEDGVTETKDRTIDRRRNWGGDVVKVLQTEYTQTYKWTFLESLNADVLKMVYGDDNVDIDIGADGALNAVVRKNKRKLKRRTWCIDSIDTELDANYRDWIIQGQIVETGDVTLVHSDVIAYDVTVEAFPDPAGDNAIQWIHKPAGEQEVIEPGP